MRSEDSPELLQWLERKTNWTSHEIKNEIIELMAHSVLRQTIHSIRSNKFFSIIVDEATDCSFKEQVSICFRHVDTNALEVHKEFVGLYETENTTADILTRIIKDVIYRLGLDLKDCRGQGYDGASNMSGRLSGVQARISAEYPKALYIHCFCHSQNLAGPGLFQVYSTHAKHLGYHPGTI